MNDYKGNVLTDFKWGLLIREFLSLLLLVVSILNFHYSWILWPYDDKIIESISEVSILVFIIYILGAIPNNPFKFKEWYNYQESVVQYNPVDMYKDAETEYPKRDAFWEYMSILSILVIPSSFFISFLITVYWCHTTTTSLAWYYWVIAACIYFLLVVRPGLYNLGKFTYHPTPKIRKGYIQSDRIKRLQQSLSEFENLTEQIKTEEVTLHSLEIPIPAQPTECNPAPYIEYVKNIADIGKSHPEVASLEQLLLSVTSFPLLSGWEHTLFDSFKAIGHVGAVAQHGMWDTVKSMGHFVAHPDHNSSSELYSNILERLKESGGSKLFKIKLMHSSNKLGVLGKEDLKDAAKESFDTFSPDDFGDKFNASIDNLENAFSELFQYFVPEIDLPGDELFEPDFDFTGHFPMISSTREIFKNIGRYTDGDVDMGGSITHSLTKIAGVATLGAAIGTMIFPGAGTIIGSMIGSWLWKSDASKLNAMELNRLKDEFESERVQLDYVITSAQSTIKAKQEDVNTVITDRALYCNQNYKDNIEVSPLDAFDINDIYSAMTIMIYDYIWDCAEQYSPKTNKYNSEKYGALLQCLANRSELAISKEMASYQMISSLEKLLTTNIKEPDNLKLDYVIDAIHNVIISYALSMQALHLVWMERTRLLYTSAVREVAATVEQEFESLNTVVKEQEGTVKDQSDKCKRLAEDAEREAKTL